MARRVGRSQWAQETIGFLLATYLRLVQRTSRFTTVPGDLDLFIKDELPLIAAMWHGQHLMMPLARPKTMDRLAVLISRHEDAGAQALAAERLDIIPVRGSGGPADRVYYKGGASAMRELMRQLDSGVSVAMTADVPKRARVAGLGIVALAKLSGRPIVPTAVVSSLRVQFHTWDRATLGLPLGRAIVVAGDLIRVSAEADDEEMEAARRAVERGLDAAHKRAYAMVGASDPGAQLETGMTPPLSLLAYRLASFLATPLAGPILAMRLRRGKEDARRIGERRGLTRLARPLGPLVWLHGASVGEAAVLLPFVERITRTGATALVTTGTLTSAAMLAQRLPPGAVHQYAPLDSPLFVRRFLKHWRPDAALVAESELWPNMIVELKRSGLPLAMVNGRISERSLRRWMKAPRFIAALMKGFDLCLARSESDGERLVALGAPRVVVAGDVKFDAPTLPADRRELAELAGLTSGRQIWIAASTHDGEEMIAAAAHKRLRQVFPDVLTLIAPRHPDRGEAVLRQLETQGLVCALRSRGDAIGAGTAIYVCDTIGELGLFYRLAGVVFVGKSFAGGGGQNPIEPARLACAILHGPMVANFADAYAALDEAGGAFAIGRPEDLGDALVALFVDGARLRAMARAAGNTVERRAGAVDRSMRALAGLLPVAEAAR